MSTETNQASRFLDLSNQKLTALPSEYNYSDFEKIDLSRNSLDVDQLDLSLLSHVKALNLSHNEFRTLPNSIGLLKSVEDLDLRNNFLTSLPKSFTELRSLRILTLASNLFAKIPRAILKLPLEHFDMASNSLDEIPPYIAKIQSLRVLRLGPPKTELLTSKKQNRIRFLPVEMGELTSLRELQLNGNRIEHIPGFICRLPDLQLLDVAGNRIRTLSPELAGPLSRGLLLRINANPLAEPLPQVIERGFATLASYLASLDDAVANYEAKVILVGEGNVGKTSLVRRLSNEPFVPNLPTTHGIEIRRLEVRHPALENVNLILHFWDFGGQEVYRITHQFFFSHRSLYILAWNPRQGQEQDEVEGWIRRIRLRVGNAVRILIVATHADERNPELDYARLKDEFGDLVVGRYAIDSLTDRGLPELQSSISNQVASLPQMGRQISSRWLAVRDAVLGLAENEPQISYEEFMEVCAENNVFDKGEVQALLELFHDLGHVIYYGSDLGLQDIVVLNAEWLTKAIGYVLEDTTTRESCGVLEHSRLGQIWNDSPGRDGYNPRYHPYFLRLMEKFDVCYRLGDEGAESLIAQLVPFERPELPWRRGDALPEGLRILNLICLLSEPAPGLVAWLTVRLHRATTGRHWRRGVFLRHGIDLYDSEALLELIDERSLMVEVRAPSPELFFNVVRDSIEDLVTRRWPGLTYTLLVPCPSPTKPNPCPGRFKLDALHRLRDSRVETIFCQDCFVNHDVSMLLTGFNVATAPFQEQLESLSSQLSHVGDDVKNLQRYASQTLDSVRRILRAINTEITDCPRLFTIYENPGDVRVRFWRNTYVISLWCEHSEEMHPCSQEDSYLIEDARQFVKKVAPYAALVVKTLQIMLPVAGAVAGLAVPPDVFKSGENQLELMKSVIEALPGGDGLSGQLQIPFHTSGNLTYAESDGLRSFRALLFEIDRAQRFGGLARVQDATGSYLWVCKDHYPLYDPGLPSLNTHP